MVGMNGPSIRGQISTTLAAATFFGALCAAPSTAQDAAEVTRIRGIVDKDATWSGTILITENTILDGASVTVTPGTLIEFCDSRMGGEPILTVGGPEHATARLSLQGTADKPITIRTRPGTGRGRIFVHVLNQADRKLDDKPTAAPNQPVTTLPAKTEWKPEQLEWRHVRFESLGSVRAGRTPLSERRRLPDRRVTLAEPAVEIRLADGAHTVAFRDCVFEDCQRLTIRGGGDARIVVASNRFARATERVNVEIAATDDGRSAHEVSVKDNWLDASLVCAARGCETAGNTLIGPHTSIVIKGGPSDVVVVRGNYVHCTAPDDDGHYCLDSENPDARIEENVFRGGTTCVQTGTRRMSRNVLIAAASLRSETVRNAKTHQIVAALPPGAVFEGNLLIGPAYSMVIPQASPGPGVSAATADPNAAPTVIRGNVFDGMDGSTRAIHVNALGRAHGRVDASNNLFLRVPTLVYDEAGSENTVVYMDYNAVAPRAERAYERVKIADRRPGDPGWGAKDLILNDLPALNLREPPRPPLGEFDDAVISGKVDVFELWRRLINAYAPQPGSPLIGAGRPVANGEPGTIGLPGMIERRSTPPAR